MALEGVGPSIARGNQEEKGNCADLAAADIKIIIEEHPDQTVRLQLGTHQFGILQFLKGNALLPKVVTHPHRQQ